MGQKIVQLSESVINQIAAGEVVESPASVVKELLENSLDANATEIIIRIQDGGKSFIEVEDNGKGMSREDALLSLQRYATSKIREVEDLFSLSTMGFRGEALAAISSISYFTMKTCDGKEATLLKGKAGKVELQQVCARNQGTSISISSLFYNVPARKKFQKSSSATSAAITKIIQIVAIAHPEVSFTYLQENKEGLFFPKQSKKERIEAIFGQFPYALNNPDLWGVFGAFEEASVRKHSQYIFVNDRPVFSPLITKAVQMGYGTRLKENTFPAFVLFIQILPDQVDVNVHPQKKEIRFFQEQHLFEKIRSSVEKIFINASEYKSIFFSKEIAFHEPPSFSFAEAPPQVFPSFEQSHLPWQMMERVLFITGKYCFLEKDGVVLLDLSLALSRVLFEQMQEKQIEVQTLLSPIEVQSDEPDIVERLEKLHIQARFIGPKHLAIDAIPSLMDATDFPQFFRNFEKEKKIAQALSQYCLTHRLRYTFEQALDLWKQLQKCKETQYDPFGKKIWVKLQQTDLDAWMTKGFARSKNGS